MLSPIEEIKSRLDIVDLVQSYIKLQKAGSNYRTNCPFHGEKTPSFFVSPARQIWHCFGCQRGGDVFKFVMEIEGLDFPEALRLLAQKTGVILKREDSSLRSEKNRLYDICECAAQVFEKKLSLAPVVKNYLKKRGVADKTIEEFRIGFSPPSWDFLLKNLLTRGFKREEIEKAGLVVRSEEKSSWYDRFRNRIMFPINDANGRVMGFGGRIFEEVPTHAAVGTPTSGLKDQNVGAKYINSPQTPIYDKSSVLYGFDKAKQEIRTRNQVVLVEGYMDCLMSHQAGLKNTVAVSGTALTSQQAKSLRRLCDTIVASFDADAAGESATRRSLVLAAQFEFERKIAAIPAGKDPADTVAENPTLWLGAVAGAKPVVEFYFEKTFREKNLNHANGKKEIAAILLPLLAELTNEIEKAHWTATLAEKLEIKEDSVWKEMKKIDSVSSSAYGRVTEPILASETNVRVIPVRRDLLEEHLLIILPLVRPEVVERELDGRRIIFTSRANQEMFDLLISGQTSECPSSELREKIDSLRFRGEVFAETVSNPEEEFIVCRKELEKIYIKEELRRIGAEIQVKEKAGDAHKVSVLLQDFKEVSNKLKTL